MTRAVYPVNNAPISGQLLRYFNHFKITAPTFDFHKHARLQHGGQITIYLSEDITIHYLQRILPKISARLTQKKITPGHLDSDATTHFNYISMRYDGGTDSEYIPAEYTGRNYNPYNQSSPFNHLIKTPEAFSLTAHFLKFNLTHNAGYAARVQVQICIAAYMREIGKDEEAVINALTDPDVDNRDIRGDQAAWCAALQPDFQPSDAEDIEYLRIVFRYLENHAMVNMRFSGSYPGTNAELKAFFAAIDLSFAQIEFSPKDPIKFVNFYLEQICATANGDPAPIFEYLARTHQLLDHENLLDTLTILQNHWDLDAVKNAIKVITLFQILEIPVSNKEELIAKVTLIVEGLANNESIIKRGIIMSSQVMQIGALLFGEEENKIQLAYQRPNYKIEYEKLLRALLNDHIKPWDPAELCIKMQTELTTQKTTKTLA